MRRRITFAGALGMLLVSTTSALAQDASAQADTSVGVAADASEAKRGGAVLAGAKVGGIVPFGGLSPFVTVGLEAGYVFPWMHRAFAGVLFVDYTAPSQSGSQADPRLGTVGSNASYDWKIRQKELAFMPAFVFRVTSLGKLTPYAGIGPRIYLLQSTVQGSAAGSSIGETTEQSTKVGVGVPLGVEYELGPGGLLAELLLQYGGLDHRTTGETNTGALSLSVGYRFLL